MIEFEHNERYRAAWVRFLATDAAKAGIAWLRETKRPVIRRKCEPHEVQMDAGAQLGFDEALKEVDRLGVIQVTPDTGEIDSDLNITRRG